jgi:hypothetical protein
VRVLINPSYRDAGILAIAARTCAADQIPPRGAEIPRPSNSFAIERSEFAPAVRISSMIGARSAARDLAASDLARRLAARFGGRKRRSRAIGNHLRFMFGDGRHDVDRETVPCGKSTASNSTFDSIKLEMKATLRAKRSSLAMISLAP